MQGSQRRPARPTWVNRHLTEGRAALRELEQTSEQWPLRSRSARSESERVTDYALGPVAVTLRQGVEPRRESMGRRAALGDPLDRGLQVVDRRPDQPEPWRATATVVLVHGHVAVS